MKPSDTAEEINHLPGATGPGNRLQSARIDRGLSLEDVANRMHLSTAIIQAIEENDFDVITAPIFVKGYLRSYARIVLLDEDEMIAQYTGSFSDDDPSINTTSTLTAEVSVADARVKWTTFLVIFVLTLLLAIWWWNKSQNKADVFSLDALQTDTLPQSDAADNTMLEEIEAVSETSAGTTNETFGAQSVDVETENPEPIEDLDQVLGAQQATPDDSQSEAVASEEIQQEQIDDAELVENSELISRSAPIGLDHLLVIVHADTWADIKDSGGHQLAYDLLRAGQEIEMTGQAPFSVFLGNGHGVELIYNDESIDINNSIRDDNTARLKIGS